MNELKAARAVAEHWRRRYQAAQALIAELQGENEQLSNKLDWAREVVIERWTKADEKIAELQGEKRHLKFGLNDAIRTIEELRNDEQALYDRLDDQVIRCSETIGELQRALDEARERAAGWQKSANTAVIRVLKKLEDSRRWSAAWKRAAVRYRHGLRNLDPRIARLERITPGDPIQGVEDMYFTGESWQTEDE